MYRSRNIGNLVVSLQGKQKKRMQIEGGVLHSKAGAAPTFHAPQSFRLDRAGADESKGEETTSPQEQGSTAKLAEVEESPENDETAKDTEAPEDANVS